MRLTGVKAIRSLDLHGSPAIAIRVRTENSEAWSQAHVGKNTDAAIENFNALAKKFKTFNFQKFEGLKRIENLFNLNNATMAAVEYAILKLFSAERKKPVWKALNPNTKTIPRLLVNVAGRQLHNYAEFDLHEILVSPQSKNISDAAFAAANIFSGIRKTSFNNLPVETALELVDKKISGSNCKINLGIDVHASSICKNGKYLWKNFSKRSKGICADEKKQIDIVERLANRFDLSYVEDPLHKDAFKGFSKAKLKLNKYGNRLVAGDSLIATELDRLKTALKQNSVNAVVVDPRKSGSLIATKNIIDFARKNGISTIFEAHDEVGVHLAHAWQADFIKFAMPGVEINEILRIADAQSI